MFEWPGPLSFRRTRATRAPDPALDLEGSSTSDTAAEHSQEEQSGLFYLHPASREEADPSDSSILDVVAVHGLGGHWEATWRKGDTVWLRDLLPTQLLEQVGCNVRVLSYGYKASVFFSNSSINVRNAANTLLQRLYHARESDAEKKRNLVFVAHSVGGIIVKQVLYLHTFLGKSLIAA